MSRILVPFETGDLQVPQGRVLFLNAQPGPVLARFERLDCVQDLAPVRNALPDSCLAEPAQAGNAYDLVMLEITRDRDANRALVAAAWDHAADGAVIVVSGAKNDGIDAIGREIAEHLGRDGVQAKAHGKTFWLTKSSETPAVVADWRALSGLTANRDGFLTAPGMFSQDHADPGSRLLLEHLPVRLGAHVIDLGAGWGYLAAGILGHPDLARVDLVEASHAALKAARANVTDPRARFNWADARNYEPEDGKADTVIMNPPFHSGRAAEPSLGQAFVATAARCLKPGGQLFLVANRHLPYENTLRAAFNGCESIADAAGYKILTARNPRRTRP